ncbi:hypothetical protein [uncultured Duncaniella sp.]|uniref:hypothetical protein n=1 Tax=uncultured Duncaniella sp. TaxID=2768039 RepID=UPI0025A9837E|nr:hypothetical protein [uncultured Duncaniella sp.]
MDIQKLTDNYRERFEAFYGQPTENISGKNKKKTQPECPNYLCEVVRPVLDALVDLLPEYGFSKTTDKYAMVGDYYRIKASIILIGGFSVNEDFGLMFTPFFRGKPCGESQKITDSQQLVNILRKEFEKRNVKMKT